MSSLATELSSGKPWSDWGTFYDISLIEAIYQRNIAAKFGSNYGPYHRNYLDITV